MMWMKLTAWVSVFIIGILFLGGWTWMLTFGIIHAWWPHVPSMNYWTALEISAATIALGLYGALMQALGAFFKAVT
jgi:hypothetical protein